MLDLAVYEVFVRKVEFYGHHGVPATERELGHRYRADITAKLQGNAPYTDDVAESVDYVAMASLISEISQRSSAHTLERLSYEFCEEALKRFQHVQEIQITLEKPMPPANIMAEATGVTFSLKRSSSANSQ
jgi:dihydroneopterin aldolase